MESEITLDDLDIDLLKLISYQLDPKDCFNLSLSCKKCSELITNVYYWHENPNSITRINNCQYAFGGSKRDILRKRNSVS